MHLPFRLSFPASWPHLSTICPSKMLTRSLDHRWSTSIAWRAYGLDGGDCRSIHRCILDEVLPGGGDSSEETAHRAAEELFHGDSRALRSEGGGRRPKVRHKPR